MIRTATTLTLLLAATAAAAQDKGDFSVTELWSKRLGDVMGYSVQAFSPDGKQLLCGVGDFRPDVADKVFVVDSATGDVKQTFTRHKELVMGGALTRDGYAFTCDKDGIVLKWSMKSGAEVARFDNKVGFEAMALSPDEKSVAVSNHYDVIVLRTDKSAPAASIRASEEASGLHALAFSPDGTRLATGSEGVVKIWDAKTWKVVKTLRSASETIWNVEFSPDGKRLIAAERGGGVRLWDVATGAERWCQKAHGTTAFYAIFHPSAGVVVSNGEDQLLRFWDVESGRELHQLNVRERVGLSFSRDGKLLAALSWRGTVTVWRFNVLALPPTPGDKKK